MNAIRVENLCKSFHNSPVLENVSLTVVPGERIAIIGPSGCGKSLFLRSLLLLEKPDSGRIFIGEEEITSPKANINRIRRQMGMVYQGFHLFEHKNVLDNITCAPRKLKKIPKTQAEDHALELLRSVGLENKKNAMPNELSGGQQQRIAIVRSLAMNPKIMLFDEPTSALDPVMTGEVLAAIRKLARKELTMILVTHEMNFAREFATRILFFEDHGIYESGTPEEILDAPQKIKTQAFLRRLKFFSTRITSRNFDLMNLQGGIIAFAEKYGISGRISRQIQLCAEEIIYELIDGCYRPDEPADLKLEIEYSQSDRKILMICECGGKQYDLFRSDTEDSLGITLLKKSSEQQEYRFDGAINHITLHFSR